jgi:hypothetical protein
MEQLAFIFMLCGIAAGAFTLFMILFRPEQYAQLLKAEEERKQAAEARKAQRAERLGKAAKGAMTLAEMFLKKK